MSTGSAQEFGDTLKSLETNLGYWVIRNRWWIIAASVIVALGAGSGMQHLAFNMDTRVFFSEDNPQLQALEELLMTRRMQAERVPSGKPIK